MTQNPQMLSYVRSAATNPLRVTVTWILLLAIAATTPGLAILICGVGLVFITGSWHLTAPDPHFWLRWRLILGCGLSIGVVETLCSFKIRRRSLAAVLTAGALMLAQLACMVYLDIGWLQDVIVGGGSPDAWVGNLMLGGTTFIIMVMCGLIASCIDKCRTPGA